LKVAGFGDGQQARSSNSPLALRLPKQILRHCTPVRRARSTLLLVGSSPLFPGK
jgi:hypothetical protein